MTYQRISLNLNGFASRCASRKVFLLSHAEIRRIRRGCIERSSRSASGTLPLSHTKHTLRHKTRWFSRECFYLTQNTQNAQKHASLHSRVSALPSVFVRQREPCDAFICLSSVSVRVDRVIHMLIANLKPCFLFHPLISHSQQIAFISM